MDANRPPTLPLTHHKDDSNKGRSSLSTRSSPTSKRHLHEASVKPPAGHGCDATSENPWHNDALTFGNVNLCTKWLKKQQRCKDQPLLTPQNGLSPLTKPQPLGEQFTALEKRNLHFKKVQFQAKAATGIMSIWASNQHASLNLKQKYAWKSHKSMSDIAMYFSQILADRWRDSKSVRQY